VATDVKLGTVSTEDRAFYWAFREEPDPSYRLLTPQLWMRRARLFRELPRDLDPAALARLYLRRDEYPRYPRLESCVAEAVFEAVRTRVAPDAPSRLECLFAALDAESAARFAIEWLEPTFDFHGISDIGTLRVRTRGAPWIALDMNLVAAAEIDELEEANAWSLDRIRKSAERYWRGERSRRPFVEVLAMSLQL
jgi:hypothetical protein